MHEMGADSPATFMPKQKACRFQKYVPSPTFLCCEITDTGQTSILSLPDCPIIIVLMLIYLSNS
jgi:hypothetical protein